MCLTQRVEVDHPVVRGKDVVAHDGDAHPRMKPVAGLVFLVICCCCCVLFVARGTRHTTQSMYFRPSYDDGLLRLDHVHAHPTTIYFSE